MKGTNSSNDRLILRQNVEINSNEHVSCDVFFREWNRRPRGLETSLRNHQEKCLWVQSYFNIYYGLSNNYRFKFSFLHHWLRLVLSFSFKKNPKLSVITEALFGKMCRSATASLVSRMVNTNLEAQKLRLRQHRPFMSIKSFEQTQQVGRVTR